MTQKLLELKRNLLIINNHDKYIATPELFTLDACDFNARLAEANLVTKTDFDNSVSNLDRKTAANKKKITSNENKLKKVKTFDSSYFSGRSHFEENRAQIYLVFQPINKYFKVIASTDYVSPWKSKGLSNETIKLPATFDNSLTPALSYYGTKTRINVYGSCLKQPKLSYTHGTIVNIYIAYELGASSSHFNDPTLKNWLFGAVTLTKNADIDKYGYSGYGIRFDRKSSFSFPGGRFGSNVIIFGVDINSSAHIDNKKKDILILGKGLIQGLEYTLTTEKMYSINFTVIKTKFCLSLHYNEWGK